MADNNKPLSDTKLKKYKLTDLVANGSRARLKVDSDLLVGDSSNGFAYGDILDANATEQLIREKMTGLAGNDFKEEITQEILEIQNKLDSIEGSGSSYSARVEEDNLIFS